MPSLAAISPIGRIAAACAIWMSDWGFLCWSAPRATLILLGFTYLLPQGLRPWHQTPQPPPRHRIGTAPLHSVGETAIYFRFAAYNPHCQLIPPKAEADDERLDIHQVAFASSLRWHCRGLGDRHDRGRSVASTGLLVWLPIRGLLSGILLRLLPAAAVLLCAAAGLLPAGRVSCRSRLRGACATCPVGL